MSDDLTMLMYSEQIITNIAFITTNQTELKVFMLLYLTCLSAMLIVTDYQNEHAYCAVFSDSCKPSLCSLKLNVVERIYFVFHSFRIIFVNCVDTYAQFTLHFMYTASQKLSPPFTCCNFHIHTNTF